MPLPPNQRTQDAEGPRVLVYTHELLPRSQTFIYEQARALRSWRPILVGDRRARVGLEVHGVDSVALGERRGRFRRMFDQLLRQLGLPPRRNVERLRELGASLVHAHFGTAGVDALPFAEGLGLPLVVTLHGFDVYIDLPWWQSGAGGWWRRQYPRQLMRMAELPQVHFIAVSNALRERAVSIGIPAAKISVRHIGVDTSKFNTGVVALADRPMRVIFVGRLVEKKGLGFLIKAFADVARAVPNVELVVIGEGPLGKQLRELASQLAIRVDFVGACTPGEVAAHLNESRVLCLPSITAANGDAEGLPIVVLEAQASGIPVVTSAKGGRDEGIEDGKTGFAHEEGDVAAITLHLTTLLSDPALLTEFGSAARERTVSLFDLKKCTFGLESLYDSLSARK